VGGSGRALAGGAGITRRALLGGSLAAAAAGLLGSAARQQRPNVLLVVVDDLNDWIGCLGGHPDTRTPHIDRLAARGLLFTRAYCNAPLCNPSRASLFTGIRPSTSGVYDNRQPFRRVLPEAVTLQQHLMAHGYRTMGRGKIFHARYPDPASWDEYVPKGGNPEPPRRPLNGVPDAGHFDWGPLDVPEGEMDDAKVVAWCAERLQQPQPGPFLLACGLNTPHLPWYVPREYAERFSPESVSLPPVKDDDLADLPPAGRELARQRQHHRIAAEGIWRGAVAGYLASIAFTDHLVGRLLDAFDTSPHRDDTWIVFLGDQGFHLGEKLHWRKASLWEEATRVPLLLVGPGAAAGSVCWRTVSFIDLHPTLCELCGVPGRSGLEGASLARLVADPGAAWDRPALTTSGRGNHSVRSERWRYIRYADGGEELYDHGADPLEWRNRAADPALAPVVRELAAWLPERDAPDAPRDAEEEAG
jgi:arylsulfatase A-like enzyme